LTGQASQRGEEEEDEQEELGHKGGMEGQELLLGGSQKQLISGTVSRFWLGLGPTDKSGLHSGSTCSLVSGVGVGAVVQGSGGRGVGDGVGLPVPQKLVKSTLPIKLD
jgi:hypothetical protein